MSLLPGYGFLVVRSTRVERLDLGTELRLGTEHRKSFWCVTRAQSSLAISFGLIPTVCDHTRRIGNVLTMLSF